MRISRFGVFAAVVVATASAVVAAYDHEVKLDDKGRYLIRWTVAGDTLRLSLDAETTGWVGFGLGSKASMLEADMAVAYVDSAGATHVQDRNTKGFTTRAMPAMDKQQDWTVSATETGSEAGGRTVVHLERKLRTCDAEDEDVPTGTARVLWALGPEDPADPTGAIGFHSLFGTVSIDLTSRDPRAVTAIGQLADADTEVFPIALGDTRVTVPKEHTYYHCRGVTLADAVVGRHMVASGVGVETGNERHVHHVLVYECPADMKPEDAVYNGECHDGNMPDALRGCNAAKPIAAWAIGGGVLVLPDDLGIPIESKYLLIETHFDNPDLRADLTDGSHAQLLLRKADKPRPRLGQITTFGSIPSGQIIPPGSTTLRQSFTCPAECTKTWPKAINVYGVFLHSHLAGRQIYSRHFRDGTELPPIATDASYDFNLQAFKALRTPIEIRPGDQIKTECVYDTSGRTAVTYGGEATTSEMCLQYAITDKIEGGDDAMRVCWAYANPSEYLNEFGNFLVSSGAASADVAREKLTAFAAAKTEADKNKFLAEAGVTWTQPQITAFEKAYNAARQYSSCPGDSIAAGKTFETTFAFVPYVPPPVCPGDPTPFPKAVSGTTDPDASAATATGFAWSALAVCASAALVAALA
eukprot:TRINITY_DN4105_c0_g2_i1.p2 TRINITY_DN4105_c0_g2~~TRINITY_DN4105_c0_g2_i1.p2  ORF type:complete len:671 (+),score=321.47 TRINITY_DN4105_c0_g2_i1:92-2014(+)